MVDGGGRCSCQDDFDPEAEEGDPPPACCSPQVFTSVLLGVLACVLMTGGVFLAFHRWDPLWLIVSGIGVLLILIGSILHCCSNSADNSRTRHRGPAGKGGCCGGRPPPDHLHHGHHLLTNNGSLTEQLLPLSNARSVSQLSLNMLPGYFPPVMTTYGIEQHSAVVQNINRLVQQQQGPVPGSPGVQSSGGKSFILLSLPGNDPAQQANVQNLVGYTVYQLEESSAMESPAPEATPITPPATTTVASSPIAAPTTSPVHPPLFKSVEVQTCHAWPITSSGINPNNSQNACSSNSSTELTPSENIPNNKPLQNASCSSSPTESAPTGIIQNIPMQKSSSSNSSTITANLGISQNSFSESATPRMGHNNVPKNSIGNSSTESLPSQLSPLQKTCSHNSSTDLAAADPQQPSTSRNVDVAEVTNLCTAGIPPICDNAKSSGGTTQSLQASITLEDTPVSEASSSVLVGISESTAGESLFVAAIPLPSTDNLNLLELATPSTTDILVEVDTTSSIDISPVSITSVDIPSISPISSISPSVSVTFADVRAMSASSVNVSPVSTTSDVLPLSTISADVPVLSSDVLINISDDTTCSPEIATSSGNTVASIDSTQQTTLDVASDPLQVGVSSSDLSLSNLSDVDGELDDSELLDRFSPPPSYDDAIHEGENAIGAFGLAYGTI